MAAVHSAGDLPGVTAGNVDPARPARDRVPLKPAFACSRVWAASWVGCTTSGGAAPLGPRTRNEHRSGAGLHRLRGRTPGLRKRLHLDANVMSTLALFFALAGGTAVALTGSNTVFNDDIVNDEVTTADVRDDTLAFGGLYSPDLGPPVSGLPRPPTTRSPVPTSQTAASKASTSRTIRSPATTSMPAPFSAATSATERSTTRTSAKAHSSTSRRTSASCLRRAACTRTSPGSTPRAIISCSPRTTSTPS